MRSKACQQKICDDSEYFFEGRLILKRISVLFPKKYASLRTEFESFAGISKIKNHCNSNSPQVFASHVAFQNCMIGGVFLATKKGRLKKKNSFLEIIV